MENFGGDVDLKENLDIPDNKQPNNLAKIKSLIQITL
jgi:hypothetical protein